jgi:hypothetical protein
MKRKQTPFWTRTDDGKYWLFFQVKNRHYEVGFGADRFVDGFVLYWDGKEPPLVKGMMAPDLIVNDDLDDWCPEASLEIERFQASVRLKLGVGLDKVRPEDVDPLYPNL